MAVVTMYTVAVREYAASGVAVTVAKDNLQHALKELIARSIESEIDFEVVCEQVKAEASIQLDIKTLTEEFQKYNDPKKRNIELVKSYTSANRRLRYVMDCLKKQWTVIHPSVSEKITQAKGNYWNDDDGDDVQDFTGNMAMLKVTTDENGPTAGETESTDSYESDAQPSASEYTESDDHESDESDDSDIAPETTGRNTVNNIDTGSNKVIPTDNDTGNNKRKRPAESESSVAKQKVDHDQLTLAEQEILEPSTVVTEREVISLLTQTDYQKISDAPLKVSLAETVRAIRTNESANQNSGKGWMTETEVDGEMYEVHILPKKKTVYLPTSTGVIDWGESDEEHKE